MPADSVRIGERFELVLTARHDTAAQVLFPDPARGDTVLGDLEVLSIRQAGWRESGDARVDSVVYAVTTFTLDTAFVPPLPVHVVQGPDTLLFLSSAATVPVVSTVPPDAAGLQPVTDPTAFAAPLWAWVLLTAALLLLVGLIAYYMWSRQRSDADAVSESEPDVPPYEAAMEQLQRLEADVDLNDPAQVKPFYVQLSRLLRTYLERRLGVHALEETTAELMRDLRALAAGRRLPDDVPERVRRVLMQADLVKFADARPSADDGRDALSTTRHAIDIIENARRPHEPEQPAA